MSMSADVSGWPPDDAGEAWADFRVGSGDEEASPKHAALAIPGDGPQATGDDLAVFTDTQMEVVGMLRGVATGFQSLVDQLARKEQELTQVRQQSKRKDALITRQGAALNQLQNTYPVAERPEWTAVWNAICATVERWCQARPWLTRSGAFQRVENALKWEFRQVLTPPSRVAMLPTLSAEAGETASVTGSGQAYRRLRLRSLPLMRWEEAIAFLEALPPPDAAHSSSVRSDPVYGVSERAWGPAEGEGLRRVRLTCALSVRDVAARIFFAPSTIRHWEVGKRTPSAEAWARLPAAFGVSPETLARWCGGFRGQS